MKRYIATILLIALLTTLLPQLSLVARAATYSGTCGDNLTWTLNTDTGLLEIKGSGEMTKWSSSENPPWYSYRSSIKMLIAYSGVKSIGFSAFYECTALTSVTIPDSVNSILDGAFCGCSNLSSVTIPSGVTWIGYEAFALCSSLSSISVAEENLKYCSDSCGILFNKAKTRLIQCPGAFKGNYTIPNGVTSIGMDAFRGCKSLTGVTIPDSVTNINIPCESTMPKAIMLKKKTTILLRLLQKLPRIRHMKLQLMTLMIPTIILSDYHLPA